MSWLVLLLSGVLEAVWAIALDRSQGFSRPWPTAVFLAALVLSMGGLAHAMRELPVGTSYAVWVGAEPVSLLKLLCLAAIIGGVVGLKLVH